MRFKREISAGTVSIYNWHDDDKRFKDKNEIHLELYGEEFVLSKDEAVELIGALEEAILRLNS